MPKTVFNWILNSIAIFSVGVIAWQLARIERAPKPEVVASTRAGSRLQLSSSASNSTADLDSSGLPTISTEELKLLLRKSNTVIVDARERSDFEESHIDGSLNMPLHEIEVRAGHELPKTEPVLLFCHFEAACESKSHEQGTASFCSVTLARLSSVGITNVRCIRDDLCALADKGIPIVTLTHH